MWKDVTSYSRDDKERKPTTFEAKAGALRIVVTCGHVRPARETAANTVAVPEGA